MQYTDCFTKARGNNKMKNKKLLENFIFNFSKAEVLANFEMISPQLAALHHFCKLADISFKDKIYIRTVFSYLTNESVKKKIVF